MKSRNLFILLFLLSLPFSSTNLAEDSCPSGMRKTYMDDLNMNEYGSARGWLGAVCFFQFPGSLFFNRQVLIEPRFEVHLKSAVNAIDVVESSGEQKIYGYTIVISGYNNTISGFEERSVSSSSSSLSFTDIGYNNFINSLIIKFDFVQDLHDPAENSFSIRYCDTYCNSDEKYELVNKELTSQKYIVGQNNEWDFRFVYENKKISLYSGPNTVLFQSYYDLEKTLGTNIAYVGFTGFMESNRGEINLMGTFMCEDNYAIANMQGLFYKDGKLYSKMSYKPGDNITFAFSFINTQGNKVPHAFKFKIWNYNFYATQDCNSVEGSEMEQLDNYTLFISIKACTTVGTHSIKINERTKGSSKESTYTVEEGPMEKIEIVGHDGIINTEKIDFSTDIIYLNYGEGSKGEFFLSNDLKIILDLKISDNYGNKVSVPSPNTLFTFKKVNADNSTTTISANIISYELKENGDYYQMTMSISDKGTYQIEKNEYMDKPIRFDVIPAFPNISQSFCELDGYTSIPTVKVGSKFAYKCNLIDSFGNKIQISTFILISKYEFICSLDKLKPSTNSYSPTIYNDEYSYYCNYTTSEVGTFEYNAYLRPKDTKVPEKITSTINQFNVRGYANTYTMKKIYDPSIKSWIDIETSQNTQITYTPDSNGFITAIDFAESDGNILISSYEQYPYDFNLSNLEVKFYSLHDETYKFEQPLTKNISMNGKPYIGIYTNKTSTDDLFKRSSFVYSLKFTYKKESSEEEKSTSINYVLNIGSYTACFHDLDEEKTKITISSSINVVTGEDEVKLGSIILSTTDYLLYNYNIGINNIKFDDHLNNDKIKFRIVPLSIEGTYDIFVKSEQNHDGDIELIINNKTVKNFTFVSIPPQACYISWLNKTNFINKKIIGKEIYYEYNGDFNEGNLLLEFELLDKYNKTIDNKNYFNTYKDISSEEYGENQKYFNVTYDENKKHFIFKDDIPYSEDQRGWVFKMRESTCKNIYYVRYDGKKGGSPLDEKLSYFSLLNTEIYIKNEEYVDVIYKDKNDQFYGLQGTKLNNIKEKTKVIAVNAQGHKFNLNYNQTTSNYALRYKYNFTESGNYSVYVIYDEKYNLTYEKTNNLIVIDNIFSLEHSKLKIIKDNIAEMSTTLSTIIDNKIYRPNFRLDFYTKDDLKTDYDKNIDFQLVMDSDDMTRTITFIVNKDNDEFVQFNFNNDDEVYFDALKMGNYNLTLQVNEINVIYPISLLGDNYNDSSNEEYYDITKTEVNPVTINGIAGIINTITVEFRAKDGLRWNYLVDTSQFEISYSPESIGYKIETGPKKGQVVILVNQTKALSQNHLTFKYKGENIPQGVTLNIKCNELNNLKLINEATYGNVIDPPYITFQPLDAYGNLFTDLFSSTVTKEEINYLTLGTSKDNVALTANNYLMDGKYLIVQYKSIVSTEVVVKSDYFENSYQYRIYSGPINKDKSFAEITSSTTEVNGDYTLLISPKDLYNNNIDGLNSSHLKEFTVYYRTFGTYEKYSVENCYLTEKLTSSALRGLLTESQKDSTSSYTNIECKVKITKAGKLQFVVEHKTDNINCNNQCTFMVVPTKIHFSNTKTFDKNKNIYLSTKSGNSVEIGTIPKFEVSFYDFYDNQLEASIVNNIKITATLNGTDVKLCVADEEKIKSITVCPTSNGDDNENKWKYLTNGNNYYLTIKDNQNDQIKYPITIIGSYSGGSSDVADLSKTNIEPKNLDLEAGVEGNIRIEIRTKDGIRKNYWYPEPNEKIKIEFQTDIDTCNSSIEKATNPGQYNIKINCTKTITKNMITITIEEKKLDQNTITLAIVSGAAYYLEVVDTEKFSASSDKYIWKDNPSNDDIIDFKFKLMDKFKNYILENLKDSNQFTFTSETFGSNNIYYDLEFNINGRYYLFTDKINEVIEKHTWNIVIGKSKRKYSFIYTKIPGSPNTTKSFWEIDKNSYILKETSIISVYLLDKLGVNLGKLDGKLNSEKGKIQVRIENENKLYIFHSINSEYIKYTYNYEAIGDYKVSVYYNGKSIGEDKNIKVDYQKVDLKASKLYYNVDNKNDNLMLASIQTNINNLKEYPFYKLLFYTSNGERITLYDKTKSITCYMYNEKKKWDMIVNKSNDYIKLEYQQSLKDKFDKLTKGLYYIQITYNGEEMKYPLYLLGEKDASSSSEFDPGKVYINPFEIEAIAGEEKEVEIEFRALDGLRWNEEINLISFGYIDSYNFKDKTLQIQKEKGDKYGQMKLKIVQTSITNEQPNIITLSYASKTITQTISLTIKPSSLNKLKYINGAKDGTIINPSILSFSPYDEYENLCTDISDSIKYPQDKLNSLIRGTSLNGYTVTSKIYTDGKYLYAQYGCTFVTTIKVTSNYFSESYTYKLLSGPIDSKYTFAEVEKNQKFIAGRVIKIKINPRDKNNNPISSISQDDLLNFEISYSIDEINYASIPKACNIVNGNDNYIICETNVTKSGDINFGVDYSNSAVNCQNCNIKISPDSLDFSKTKVFNQIIDKEMSKDSPNTLTTTYIPIFILKFYDRFMNSILNENDVINLKVSSTIEITDVFLCIENSKLNKIVSLCKDNNDENEEKWQYITNKNTYNLKITSSNKNLIYPITITGVYTDGESGPIDVSKTYISPTTLTLTAGVEGSISLEIRTKNNVRKNHWFKSPNNYLEVKFPNNAHCSYTLSKGNNPGQYIFKFICTKKNNLLQTTILVNKVDVPQTVSIKVVPNDPSYSKLFKENYVEITKQNLGNLTVGTNYKMINKLFDTYDNLITNNNVDLSILKLKISPSTPVKNHEYSINFVAQNNGEIIITVNSTYAGEHIINGALFPLSDYIITFTHGEPNPDNSLLEVSKKEAWVEEKIKIYITPYDKYFNLIDANEYQKNSPYQIKYGNDEYNIKVINESHSIETVENINKISYSGQFYIRGYTYFFGYLGTIPIKCVSCHVNIKSKDIDFHNSLVYRYDSTKKEFEILKDGIVEKNVQEEPIYRLYPRDKYNNIIDYIPEEKIKEKVYKAHLQSQKDVSIIYNFSLNNKDNINQAYAEFVIYDDPVYDYSYSTLVKGYYNLSFFDDSDNIQYNITLLGDGKNGSNSRVDYQKTHINDQNLKFTAGESGYLVLEMRTINDERKNHWDYNIEVKSCDENDNTFKAETTKAGLMGVFQVTITTKKANTYPSLVKCPLKIIVDNNLVEALKPEMEVSPNTIVKTEILEEYFQNITKNELKNGTADNNYIFEVASYDQYNNFAETKQEIIGLKVILKGGDEIKEVISEKDLITGYRKYTVPAKKIGTYVVSASKSGSQGIYLQNETHFLIKPGAIDVSKTVIKEKVTPIQAGNNPVISVVAYDKYENQLEFDKYINNFNVIFIDANNKNFNSNSSYDSGVKKVFYTSKEKVTIVGNTHVEVKYNNIEIIDTSNVSILITPGDPFPSNSILSREIGLDQFEEYKNDSSFVIDPAEILKLNMTLYDEYNNYVYELPVNAHVTNPIMSGNKMKQISFIVTKNIANFDLAFNENTDFVHIYQHLVKGIYDLNLQVSSSLGNASFHYNMNITVGDDYHGNGDYVISKCALKPNKTSFVAGNYMKFLLELRTEDGLLYNDDIDLNNHININNGNANDSSFKSSVEKTNSSYGFYTINIYSEKKGEYNLYVELKDLFSTSGQKGIISASYNVTPDPIPFKKYTQITNKPDSKISIDSTITITFELYDKFNNIIIYKDDIINTDNFTIYNDKLPYYYNSLNYFDTTFTLNLMPKYPPKKMKINLLYNNGTSVFIFENDIEINIESEIDYSKTLISSKNKEKIKAGEKLDMKLYTFDKKNNCFDNGDLSTQFKIQVTGPIDSPKQIVKAYQIRKTKITEPDSSECNNEYEIITTDEDEYKYVGNYKIKVMYGRDTLLVQYDQVCYPLSYDINGFFLTYNFEPGSISVLDNPSFTITGSDKYGNKVFEPLYDDINISFTSNGENIDFERKQTLEAQQGTLYYQVGIRKVGNYQLNLIYKNVSVSKVNGGQTLPVFTMVPGPCYARDNSHFDLTPLNDAEVSLISHFTFNCYDQLNNEITKGGESFSVRAYYLSSTNQGDKISLDNVKVDDNENGSYNVKFVPTMKGVYSFNILKGRDKYGQEVKWELKAFQCSNSSYVLCPNKKKCVSDILQCIDGNNRCNDTTISSEKPFYCKVNNIETCTKSQTDCDCPEKYYKCPISNYCVPEDRLDLCPKFKNLNLFCISNNMKYNDDGICRKEKRKLNQRVCPIGKVLCADLSCRDSYNDCYKFINETDKRPPLLQRCIGQQIVTSATLCPSIITCNTENEVVCPTGECVSNEIYCPALKKCNDNYPYLCQNNVCSDKYENCPPSISCGENKYLCPDNICREKC